MRDGSDPAARRQRSSSEEAAAAAMYADGAHAVPGGARMEVWNGWNTGATPALYPGHPGGGLHGHRANNNNAAAASAAAAATAAATAGGGSNPLGDDLAAIPVFDDAELEELLLLGNARFEPGQRESPSTPRSGLLIDCTALTQTHTRASLLFLFCVCAPHQQPSTPPA